MDYISSFEIVFISSGRIKIYAFSSFFLSFSSLHCFTLRFLFLHFPSFLLIVCPLLSSVLRLPADFCLALLCYNPKKDHERCKFYANVSAVQTGLSTGTKRRLHSSIFTRLQGRRTAFFPPFIARINFHTSVFSDLFYVKCIIPMPICLWLLFSAFFLLR